MKPLATFAYVLLSVWILVSLVSAPSAVLAAIIKITPTIDGTIRDGLDSPKDGIPDDVQERVIVQALNVDRPIQPFEDRGIIEFDVSNLSLPLPKIELILTVSGAHGPFPFTINVFTYIGDGVLSLADFNAGSFFTSFEYSRESTVILDVTTFISRLVASGETFAGFNFRFPVPSTIPLNFPFVAFYSLDFPPAALLQQAGLFTFACPQGQGFWKNHPGAWPVTTLTLGSRTYTQAELLALFDTPPRGDASLILAHQLIAAKLNIANGSTPAPIRSTIADADTLLSQFGSNRLPYNVRTSAASGQQMVNDANVLDRYNNGDLMPDCTQ